MKAPRDLTREKIEEAHRALGVIDAALGSILLTKAYPENAGRLALAKSEVLKAKFELKETLRDLKKGAF